MASAVLSCRTFVPILSKKEAFWKLLTCNKVLDEKDFIENWNEQNENQISEEGTATTIQVKSEEFPLK